MQECGAAELGGLPSIIASTPGDTPGSSADLLDHAAPDVSLELAAELAQEVYGITGHIRPLSAEKDANFQITLESGEMALLKITNTAEDRDVTDMQTAALIHLSVVEPSLPVPHVRQTLTGEASRIVTLPTGHAHVMRLFSFLEGTVLSAATPITDLHQDVGALLARLNKALRGFHHPAAGHVLQWDIKQAARLRPILSAVEDIDLRKRLTRLIDQFDEDIAPRLPGLRAQVVHNDLNPHNLLVDAPEATRLTGIIDFGDMVHTPLICDLAVACSYQVTSGQHPLDNIVKILAGYLSVLPLERAEIDLLPDLMRLRHATTLTIAAWRAARYPENATYIRRNAAASLRGLTALDAMGTTRAINLLHRAVQTE